MDELAGKVAIVTGASRGIGAATAREFARRGAAVVLASRSTSQIDDLAAEITAGGGRALARSCDVSRYDDVARVVASCGDEFDGLDIVVNNAGVIEPVARLADSDTDEWSAVIDINLKGVFYMMRAAIPHMVAQGSGTIVNISSGAATSALEGWSHYCSSKAGVLALTRCGDKEYREKGIRVVGLSPGTVATDMQTVIRSSGVNPVSKLDPSVHIPPEWAARATVWLCTAAAEGLAGTDFSIKTEEGRRRVGLVA